MANAQIPADFAPSLLHWHAVNGRHDLPWRQPDVGPYEVWVSEIMLQQTQVKRVIPYYQRFLQRFPTVQSLAATSWETFLPYYQGLGYYARGRNMLKTAQMIVEQFAGEFPNDHKALTNLPGIGDYTADAILSFGFGQPTLAVDTNVKQVISEVLRVEEGDVDWTIIRKELEPFAPVINAALMDFANAVRIKDVKKLAPNLQAVSENLQKKWSAKKAQKEKTAFPNKSAQVVLVLHANHRLYYSAKPDIYTPFLLPEPINTRARIQHYFQQRYNLSLSVRPPRRRGYLDEKPTLLIYAQILLGDPTFRQYSQNQVADLLRHYEVI